MNRIVFAGGCFWGLEKFFSQFEGLKTLCGYANGPYDAPSYQQVCRQSGHAEAVEVLYPDTISAAQLIYAFFAAIDPTSLNKQGNDIGTNYRTGIYCTTEKQLELAKVMLQDLQKYVDKPVVVEAEMLHQFSSAEDYHQKYLDVNPGGYCHLPRQLLTGHTLPDLATVEKQFPGIKDLI